MMNFSILEQFSYKKWLAFRGYFDQNDQMYHFYVVKKLLFEAILLRSAFSGVGSIIFSGSIKTYFFIFRWQKIPKNCGSRGKCWNVEWERPIAVDLPSRCTMVWIGIKMFINYFTLQKYPTYNNFVKKMFFSSQI